MPPSQPESESQTPGTYLGQRAPSQSGPPLELISKIPHILPHERVFPIQIGSELFKLSGASLSSDAPSYFSQYFKCQIKAAEEKGKDSCTTIRTLYIDRDPVTFRDISLHLQGYHILPRDGTHFVRLFADAQFYSLPRLISQLYEESIFISIGHREFQIPRDLFQAPGNTPNFFSLGFAIFFSSPEDLFPGLPREGLIRPPSILPPCVPGRSAEVFAELLHLLRGYPVEIRDASHRAALLRDAKYFNFKAIEQRLIPHSLSFNQARRRDEIVIRLEDILKSGISVATEPSPLTGWVNYARPFVDDKPAELVLEIGGDASKIILFPPPPSAPPSPAPAPSPSAASLATPAAAPPGGGIRVEFFRDAKTRIARMLDVIASKLTVPSTTQSPGGQEAASSSLGSQPTSPGNTPAGEDLLRAIIDRDASITLDGFVGRRSPQLSPAAASAGVEAPADDPAHENGEDLKPSLVYLETQDSLAPWPGAIPGGGSGSNSAELPPRKRRRVDQSGPPEPPREWIVRTGQWRLRIDGGRRGRSAAESVVLVAVKLDCVSGERARNAQREFLGG